MRYAVIMLIMATAGCQSINEPLTANSLPEPKPSSGMPRFPVMDAAVAESDTDAAPVAIIEAAQDSEVAAGPAVNADGSTCDRYPVALSAGAVGNPCETTESFARSLGLSDDQIAQIIDAGQIETVAH